MSNHYKNYLLCESKAKEIVQKYSQHVEGFQYENMVALAVIGVVASLAATGVSIYASYAQGQAQKRIQNWNADIAMNSAIAARQQAQADATMVRNRGLKLIGAEQAAAGKSGVTLGGSVDNLMYDSSLQNELDQMTVMYRGEMSATRDVNQSNADIWAGNQAVTNASYEEAGSAISGVSGAAGTAAKGYYYYQQGNNNPSIS